MTDRERAIVMAYTGYAMLTGEKLKYFYKYLSEIMGRPIYTHELANSDIQEEIHEKSKADFILLCEKSLEEEPHVMTLEELHDDIIETVYYESKRGTFLECKKEWGVISYNVLCLIDKYDKNILRDCNTYGVLWRCWTSKPSEQQRKDTPWNDYTHLGRNK